MDEQNYLCGASSYNQKFFLNPAFEGLPTQIKDELKVMCVLFVEDVGGIIRLKFDEDGNLQIIVTAEEGDYDFDEIGSRLKIKEMRTDKKELFGQLEQYFKAVSENLL